MCRLLRTCLYLALALITAVVAFPFASQERRIKLRRRWCLQILQALDVELSGGGLPWPACFLVANHISWIDILALAAMTDAVFVSKEEVRKWPLIGWLAAHTGTLFIKRGHGPSLLETRDQAARLLQQNRSVAVFPEGTTTDGTEVLQFHGGLLQAAVISAQPVQPVAISYRIGDGGRRAAAFTGETTLIRSIVDVCSNRGVAVRVMFGEPLASRNACRKELARDARNAVLQMLGTDLAHC